MISSIEADKCLIKKGNPIHLQRVVLSKGIKILKQSFADKATTTTAAAA